MNAITPFPTSTLPDEPFDRAGREVDRWRGRCLDVFTRAEAAMTECLLTLSKMPGRSGEVALPDRLGDRYDALAAAVGVNGPFTVKCTHTGPALARFRKHTPLRNMLCHGVTEITLDRTGRWTVVLRRAALRSGRIAAEVQVIREDEAEHLVTEVSKDHRNLRSRLDHFVSGLSAKAVSDG